MDELSDLFMTLGIVLQEEQVDQAEKSGGLIKCQEPAAAQLGPRCGVSWRRLASSR